jgi:hypothetical protein
VDTDCVVIKSRRSSQLDHFGTDLLGPSLLGVGGVMRLKFQLENVVFVIAHELPHFVQQVISPDALHTLNFVLRELQLAENRILIFGGFVAGSLLNVSGGGKSD